MYSENIRQNNQYGWLRNDTNQTESNINDDYFAIPPNSTLLTIDDKVEIINENDQNIVSQQMCSSVKFYWFFFS